MKVERYDFNSWSSQYPMYRCRRFEDYQELIWWMRDNGVKYFLWSTGSGGYIFDVRENAEWFELKWA